jgi:hypothetical protein
VLWNKEMLAISPLLWKELPVILIRSKALKVTILLLFMILLVVDWHLQRIKTSSYSKFNKFFTWHVDIINLECLRTKAMCMRLELWWWRFWLLKVILLLHGKWVIMITFHWKSFLFPLHVRRKNKIPSAS